MKKQAIKLLREEIKWCKDPKNRDKNEKMSLLEVKGFIKGLRHALRLIQLLK